MNTAFSYSNITDDDVKKTKEFVEQCTSKLKRLKSDGERRQYLKQLFNSDNEDSGSMYQSKRQIKKKHQSN